MGIQLILIAALFIAGSNYCMRRSIDAGGTSKGFLMIQLFIVFLVAILLNPVRSGDYHWSSCMAGFAIAGGVVLALMMASLGRSLETGPPGLTFAALNASTVMPSVLMVLLFGASFGYQYTLWNGLGSLLVVGGLFWAAMLLGCKRARKHLTPDVTNGPSFDLLFYFFQRKALINPVFFQKTVELIAAGIAQHAPQFWLGDVAALVFFEGEGFQSTARQIVAGMIEPDGDVVWNMNGQIHGRNP